MERGEDLHSIAIHSSGHSLPVPDSKGKFLVVCYKNMNIYSYQGSFILFH